MFISSPHLSQIPPSPLWNDIKAFMLFVIRFKWNKREEMEVKEGRQVKRKREGKGKEEKGKKRWKEEIRRKRDVEDEEK